MRLTAAIIVTFSLVIGAQEAALREAREARWQQQNLPRAVEKYKQALTEAQRAKDTYYTYVAQSELASVIDQQGDAAGAEQLFLETTKLSGTPIQLSALGNLTRFYRTHNRPADEAVTYSRLLKVWTDAAGGKNLGVARYLAERAAAESAAGLAAQSESSFKESLMLLKALSADKTVFGYATLGSYANALSTQGKEAEAVPLLNESIDGLDRIMRNVPAMISGTIGERFSRAYRSRHPEGPGIATTQVQQTAGDNPEYSDAARKARVSGDVSVVIEINESGTPANVWVLKPLGLGLDEQAIQAIRQWRFRPAMRDGTTVSNIISANISFSLR